MTSWTVEPEQKRTREGAFLLADETDDLLVESTLKVGCRAGFSCLAGPR